MIGARWRRSMALNISLRRERSNVGRSDGLTAGRSEALYPLRNDGSRDFIEGYGPSEHRSKGGLPSLWRRSLLRSVEQDRSVLEERVAAAHLRGADQLAALHQDLAADGDREARRRTAGGPDWRCEYGVDAKGAQRIGESIVNGTVGRPQRSETGDWRGHGVRHLMLVPDCLPAGRPAYDRQANVRDGLISANRECRGIPPIEAKKSVARPDGIVEQRFIDAHVLDAGTSSGIDNQLPQTVRPSDRPTVRLQRRLPPADKYTRGCGRQTPRRSGQSAATPCARASRRSGTRRGRAHRDGPSCPRADRRADAARSSAGCSRDPLRP